MKKFKIEKDVPIPGRDREKYPFEEMQVGDSFLVPFTDPDTRVENGATRCRLYSYLLTAKIKGMGGFKTKREEKGVRVWKVREGVKL